MEEATELTDTQQLLRAVSPASSRQQQNIHDRHNSEPGPPVSDVCFLFFHFFSVLHVRCTRVDLISFFFFDATDSPAARLLGSPPRAIYVILAKPLRVALGF